MGVTTADYKNRLVRLGGVHVESLDLEEVKNYDSSTPRKKSGADCIKFNSNAFYTAQNSHFDVLSTPV